MNEISKYLCIGFYGFIFAAIISAISCGTTKPGTDLNKPLIDHSVEIERSENEKRELINTIDRNVARLDTIARAAGSLSGDIGEIADLFGQYDRAVWEFIGELKSIASGSGGGESQEQSKE